jgi:AcrR family transcriptional regulator
LANNGLVTSQSGVFGEKMKTDYMIKDPVQKRSRETVELLLDATERLLEKNPSYELTTDMIAEEAAISIGSLYQFFSRKEALFTGVQVRIMKRDLQTLSTILATPRHNIVTHQG